MGFANLAGWGEEEEQRVLAKGKSQKKSCARKDYSSVLTRIL